MTIGIIGSGNIGSAFARTLARAGIEATIANSRGPDSLTGFVSELGPSIRAGTREQAASADTVLVAVNWTKLPSALAGLPAWRNQIVIDANNPIEAPLFKPVDLNGRASSEVFAELVPGARVVKAFNHVQVHVLAGDPRAEGGQRVLFYSGDDPAAKAEVSGASSASISDRSPSVRDLSSFPAARSPSTISSGSPEESATPPDMAGCPQCRAVAGPCAQWSTAPSQLGMGSRNRMLPSQSAGWASRQGGGHPHPIFGERARRVE